MENKNQKQEEKIIEQEEKKIAKEITKEESKNETREEKDKKEEKIIEKAVEEVEQKENKEEVKTKGTEEKKERKKEEPKIKRIEAIVKGRSLPISTKQSVAICNYIRGKSIANALQDIQDSILMKRPVPMTGEIPHRKGKYTGKTSGSGRYPINSLKQFEKLLKSLGANANVNGLENPIITKAMANFASRPYGRFGRVHKKRTHVIIQVKERSKLKQNKKKEKKK